MISSWREFWDRDNPIYVNARHKARHYAGLAEEIAALVPRPGAHPDAHVLDHGCGEALSADWVAESCGRLLLCDASPRQRDALAQRFAACPTIVVLSPDDVAALPAASLDLVVANSLVQYLTSAELDACLRDWRRALKPGGRLILSDVIPPQLGAAADATALLAFARREGFLVAAVVGLARTLLSDYRSLRRTLGLARYDEAAMLARLREAGFRAERMPRNLGHNQRRMAFSARA